MSKTVIFKLSKDIINISETEKDDNLNNTNIINTKDLKFSLDYIKENLNLVSNFINVVIIKNNISAINIEKLDIALPILDIINSCEKIKKIIFKSKETLTLEIVLKLLSNNYIKTIECEDIPFYLLERLDINRNIKVSTRNRIKQKSTFMIDNMLNTYSEMYFKKSIIIREEFILSECIDFKNFMVINSRLKKIKLLYFSNEIIMTIMSEIKEHNKENVLIEILEKNNDLDLIFKTVNYIKKKYRRLLEDNNITFKITYSIEYKRKNLFKEINYKFLRHIILFILFVGVISMIISYYSEFKDQDRIIKQIDEFNQIFENNEIEKNLDSNVFDIQYVDVLDVSVKKTTTTTTVKYPSSSAYYTNFSQIFDTLLKKNDDTIGWLTVPETKINYPVVQSDTNSFYLDRDFYKKKNSMGWIYMDYRNNIDELSQNTIIYGHNIIQGIMFGTLKYTLNSSWYKKSSNQIITFNTLNNNMKWQIFSIYIVPKTDDYLKTEFENDNDFLKFINKLQKRSIYDFDVDIESDSKILTLSTCNNHKNRTVVHAVLIEKEDQE